MNKEGLVTAAAQFEDFDIRDDPHSSQNDLVFVATHPSDPKSLDKGLRGPDAKK